MANNNQQSSHILGMSDFLMKIMIIEREDNGDDDNFEIILSKKGTNLVLMTKTKVCRLITKIDVLDR